MQRIAMWVLLLGVVGFSVGLGFEKYGANFDFGNQGFPGPAEASKMVCDNPPTYELQIVKLPEDGQAYHTSLFLPDNWQSNRQCTELVAAFETDAKLKSLKAQTHWHVYTPRDQMFPRYQAMVPVLPAVVVQKASGQKVYAAAGDAIPRAPSLLAADIQGNLYANCPNRPRPAPEPVQPAPINGPPKLDEPPATPDSGFPLVLAAIAAAIGLGIGAGTKYHEQYYGKGV